jgi:hypothetical protein
MNSSIIDIKRMTGILFIASNIHTNLRVQKYKKNMKLARSPTIFIQK